MAFYEFRLDRIDVRFQRGKIPDNDLVTFGVFINQVDRGHGVGNFTDVITGASVPASGVQPESRVNMSKQWIIGPLEVASGDGVSVVYTGMNLSDTPGGLNAQQQSDVELKILDSVTSAVVGAAGLGLVGSALASALGFLGDPIGKLLGVSKQFPCNGLVFSDGVPFTGAGLESLFTTSSTPNADEVAFTKSYTDEATHDQGTCGRIAETDVTFSVLRVPSVSILSQLERVFGDRLDLKKGLRQFASTPSPSISLRSLLRLRP